MKRLTVVCFLLCFAGGCFELHQKDPLTVKALDRALEERKHDMDFARRIAVKHARPEGPSQTADFARDLNDLDALELAAEDELKAAAFRERQKADK